MQGRFVPSAGNVESVSTDFTAEEARRFDEREVEADAGGLEGGQICTCRGGGVEGDGGKRGGDALEPVVVPDREEGVGEDVGEEGIFGGEGGTDGCHCEVEGLLDVACVRLKYNVRYRQT